MSTRWQQWHTLGDILRPSSSSARLAGIRASTIASTRACVYNHGDCRRCYAAVGNKYGSVKRTRLISKSSKARDVKASIGPSTWSQEFDYTTRITKSFLVRLKKGDKAQVAAGQPSRLRFEPEEYLHVLDLWKRIGQDAGPTWPLQLSPEWRPSKDILHDLGILLVDLAEAKHPAASSGDHHVAMLAGASALGCDASTISLTRWWNTRFPQTDMALSNLLRPVATRFREILNKSNNPYALTVEALRLVDTDKPQAALRFVNRVSQITDLQSFPWRDLVESCQTKSQLRRDGDVDAALQAARDPTQQTSQAAMETLMNHSPLEAERRRAAERHFMIEPNMTSLRFLAEHAGSANTDTQKDAEIIQKEWKQLYETMKVETKEAER